MLCGKVGTDVTQWQGENSKRVPCIARETPHHIPTGCVSGHAVEVKTLPVKLKAIGYAIVRAVKSRDTVLRLCDF